MVPIPIRRATPDRRHWTATLAPRRSATSPVRPTRAAPTEPSSHTVDPSSASVLLDASPVRTTLADGQPSEEIALTFANRSESDVEFNPNSWYVWQKTGGEWQEREQEWSGHGKVTVAAGETHTWSFVEAVSAIQRDPQFDPGRYAAEIRVPDPVGDRQVACAALLELEAGE